MTDTEHAGIERRDRRLHVAVRRERGEGERVGDEHDGAGRPGNGPAGGSQGTRERAAQRDPLQHPGQAQVAEREALPLTALVPGTEGQRAEQHAEQREPHGATQQTRGASARPLPPVRHGATEHRPGHGEEEREHRIGEAEAVPGTVHQPRRRTVQCGGDIHQQHQDDREAAQRVEREVPRVRVRPGWHVTPLPQRAEIARQGRRR